MSDITIGIGHHSAEAAPFRVEVGANAGVSWVNLRTGAYDLCFYGPVRESPANHELFVAGFADHLRDIADRIDQQRLDLFHPAPPGGGVRHIGAAS